MESKYSWGRRFAQGGGAVAPASPAGYVVGFTLDNSLPPVLFFIKYIFLYTE